MTLSLKMALRSIGSNKLRAVLTMLGIIIGVMALVVLVSLVSGATSSVTDTISGLGSNLLTVTIEEDKGKPVDTETLETWLDEEEALGLIAPYISDTAQGSGSEGSGSVTLYGTTAEYYDIQGLQLSMGRWLKDADQENHSYVCVINETAAEELIGYTDCVGQALNLNGTKYTVVGVLADEDNNLTSVFSSGSMVAYLPYSSLVRLSTTAPAEIESFYVSAGEGHTVEEAEQTMTRLLMERFDEDDEVIGMQKEDQGDTLLVVSENGMGKRTLTSEFNAQNRGGKGVLCYKITEKTGALIGAKLVNDGREIMLITTEGIIIRMSVDDISIIGRNTSGVKLMSIEQNSDIKVASIAKVRESVTKDSNVYDEEHYEEDSESDSEDTADNV